MPKANSNFAKLDSRALLPELGPVVLLGGEPPKSPELMELVRQAEFVAAADSGAAAVCQAGRAPDLLVGDFDSLPEELLQACQEAGAEILRLPVHKDVTDGEFLLQRLGEMAPEKGWRRLLILGGLGGRLDQTLANIFCAIPLAEAGLEICFADDLGCNQELVLLAAAGNEPKQWQLADFVGWTASLLALGGDARRVELRGFEYPLAGRLTANISLGLSNVIQERQADIRLWGGNLLICLNGQLNGKLPEG